MPNAVADTRPGNGKWAARFIGARFWNKNAGAADLVNALTCAVLFVLIAAALLAGYDEWQTSRLTADALLPRNRLSPSDRERLTNRYAACAKDSNPRRLEACAVLHATLALQETNLARRSYNLEIAGVAADRAIKQNPLAGESYALCAFVRSVRERDAPSPRTTVLVAQSYNLTPFSRELGLWRVGYGARHWGELDWHTRHALLDEALWYGRIGPDDAHAVLDALHDTQPFIAVSIRLSNSAAADVPFPARPE